MRAPTLAKTIREAGHSVQRGGGRRRRGAQREPSTELRRTSAVQGGGSLGVVELEDGGDRGGVRKVGAQARRRVVGRVEEEAPRVVRLDDALERAVADRAGPKRREDKSAGHLDDAGENTSRSQQRRAGATWADTLNGGTGR